MKQIIVTTSWDDGHKLDLKLSSLLAKYGVAGTFYISPKNRQFPHHLLSDKQIIDLSQNFEIGAHTMTHPDLAKLKREEVELEVSESKKYLEALIHRRVDSFCYPYGHFNKVTKKIVKDSKFRTARTTTRFAFNKGRSFFEIPTTVHAYTHKLDLINPKAVSYASIDWEVLAKKQFEKTLKRGGIYHLWGHSWEIDKFNDWAKLERVLRFISLRKGVSYIINREAYK